MTNPNTAYTLTMELEGVGIMHEAICYTAENAVCIAKMRARHDVPDLDSDAWDKHRPMYDNWTEFETVVEHEEFAPLRITIKQRWLL